MNVSRNASRFLDAHWPISGYRKYASPLLAVLATCLIGGCATTDRQVSRGAEEPLAVLEHGLRPVVLKAGEPLPGWSLHERMAHYHVPGVAIAVLKNGEIVQAAGFGVREAGTHDAVDADTLFSVGSISKIVAAAASLRLVAEGKLDLDRDINTYLKSWQIPPAPEFVDSTVTMRMLLSHTSGLNVHGFEDFQPGEALPSIVDTLDGTSPAKNDRVHLVFEPGTRMKYSGGGITVEQLAIQEITGLPFESAVSNAVFQPIGMRRSTFANPLPAALGNIAKAHDDTGTLTALPRGWQTFPELAASGLWTSANELGAFAGALIKSYQGSSSFLPQTIATQMMTEVSPSWHGLGPRLDGVGLTRIFHHGGANDSYRAWIEGYLETGDGFVILTNGNGGGPLMLEIRNALSDALGHGVNPLIRAIALPADLALTDYAGSYRVNPTEQLAQRSLANYFESDVLDVTVANGSIAITEPTDPLTLELLPLTPTRFTAVSALMPPQFEFHRDAHGVVRSLSVSRGASRIYYHRQVSGQPPAGR